MSENQLYCDCNEDYQCEMCFEDCVYALDTLGYIDFNNKKYDNYEEFLKDYLYYLYHIPEVWDDDEVKYMFYDEAQCDHTPHFWFGGYEDKYETPSIEDEIYNKEYYMTNQELKQYHNMEISWEKDQDFWIKSKH